MIAEALQFIDPIAVLTALFTFGYAAYSDIQTRRIEHAVWRPALLIAVVLLALRGYHVTFLPETQQQLFAIRLGISLLLVGGLGYAFYFFRLFGGADAKGMIVLSILLPVYPTIEVLGHTLPYASPPLGVFSLSTITNGLIITLLYPLMLACRNAIRGNLSFPWSFVSHPTPTESAIEKHGKLVDTPTARTKNGLDLDALRMYLRWRDITLDDLRSDPEQYRESGPSDPSIPDDGRIRPDGGEIQDEWAAEEFLEKYEAYGTTPKQLRGGLEVLTTQETVWITDGLPLIVSFFVGLIIAIAVGDLLFLALPF